MLYRAIRPYIGKHNITIGILREHENIYQVTDQIQKELGSKVKVVILPERTRGPADTASQIINLAKINLSSPILIKDCDSFFDFDNSYMTGNFVCTAHVEDSEVLYKLYGKSFVIENESGIIQKIAEKQVISGTYCVGGYRFERADLFINAFKKIMLLSNDIEIFVSHVIKFLMTDGHYFSTVRVKNYIDVGTLDDWLRHNSNPVEKYEVKSTSDLYKELSLIGLQIEEKLLEKPYIWTNQSISKVLVSWKHTDDRLYQQICDLTKDYRGDEILLDVFDTHWIAGHPRAISKLLSSLFKLKNKDPARSLQNPSEDIAKLLWWATRLDLKVNIL